MNFVKLKSRFVKKCIICCMRLSYWSLYEKSVQRIRDM